MEENKAKLDMKYISDLNDVTTIDLALKLSDYNDKELENLCKRVKDERLADILEETEPINQKRIVNILDNNRILNIFNYMQKDDIVDVLGKISTGKSKELIKLMKEGDQQTIQQLLGYKDDCAGGLMTTEYITLYDDMDIPTALQKIKEIAPKTELIDTIFITNNEKELIGTAELRDILMADADKKLSDITDRHYIYVVPETDQEEVSLLVTKYNLNIIPVINKRRIILGIITIDDVVDVMVEEQTEDILKMGGISKEETLDSSINRSIKLRLPWLIVNLATAFLASLTVKAFESTIAQVVALSSIMSIVTGMGGNAGTQTISVIIRNISLGKVTINNAIKLLLKQFWVDLVNGAVIGLITGVGVTIIYGNYFLGIIILLAMIANLIISGSFGILIPLILYKMKIDPALSSSIFLTTATDVLGFFIFLSLANLFLPHLIN